MFKTARTHRISHNIIEQIRSAILNGDLKPKDKLPPEKILAENFGVSKASLREAFRALEALGLLEVRQGMAGGAFVKKVDLETARSNLFNYIFFQKPSIKEFTELRLLLEPNVAAIAARERTEADLADLEKNMAETLERLDTMPFYYELDTYFHHRICTIAKNRLICFVIDSVKNAVVNIKLQLELDHEFSIQVYKAHTRIFDALRRQDADMARDEMVKHIVEVDKRMSAFCDADAPLEP